MLSSNLFPRFSKMEAGAATSSNVQPCHARERDPTTALSVATLTRVRKTLPVAWEGTQNPAGGKISSRKQVKQKTLHKQERRWQMRRRMAQSRRGFQGSRERV